MPARSHNGRHRATKNATAKRRRLISGLALPTAAAAALTLTATGSAMVTSTKTRAVTFSQNAAAVSTPVPAPVDLARIPEPRIQAIEDNALALDRQDAADRAARSAARKSLDAQALEAKRVEQAHSWQLPIKTYVLTSGFGRRWGNLHAGEDFAAPVGTALVSMSTGTVVFAGEQSGFGVLVKIRYWDGTVAFYAHMSRSSVTEGASVGPGQVVGQSGNTGDSTGPHLHLEIHPDGGEAVDPVPWLADRKIAP